MKKMMLLAVLVVSAMHLSCAARGPATLHTAAAEGDTLKVNTLILSGSQLEARDKSGWTPIMHAAASGKADTVQILIIQGANVNAEDHEGNTAIYNAIGYYCGGEIFKMLATHGAKLNIRNKAGDTPLHYAAQSCSYSDVAKTNIIEILIDSGVDPAAVNQAGKSAYAMAMENYNMDMVGILRKKGVTETFQGAGAFQEAMRKPSYYAPPAGEYDVAPDRAPLYELAVADCNHMLTGYKLGLIIALGPIGWAGGVAIDQIRISRDFDKCMAVMGFEFNDHQKR